MKKILASILAVATLATCAFTSVACTKEEPVDSTETVVSEGFENEGGLEVKDVTPTAGMSLKIVKMSLNSELEPYAAEEEYQLTATLNPVNATNQRVNWSVEWTDPNSTWATGKTVTDYITVTPTADGALTASVKKLKEFGTSVLITVTSEDNAEASASCTVECMQRVSSIEILTRMGTGKELALNQAFSYYIVPEFSDGTLMGEIKTVDDILSLTVTDEVKNALSDYNLVTYIDTTGGSFEVSPTLFLGDAVETMTETEIATYENAFVSACANATGAHVTVSADYIYTYEGVTYNSGTVTDEFTFVIDGVITRVENVTLDQGSLIV